MQLERKVVMISGGSAGLGADLARRFAEEGADISLCARGVSGLSEVCAAVESLGVRCLTAGVDVRSEGDVSAWFDETRDTLGPIHAVVNNASILGEKGPIETAEPEIWRQVIDINLTGAFLVARAAIPYLRETRGSLIHVSSGVGDHGRALWGAYCASKNGLEALSGIIAGELADDGVRSNAVDPGGMRTAMRAAAYPDEDPETLPTPYEISDVFVYLAADRSNAVSGQRFRAREFQEG